MKLKFAAVSDGYKAPYYIRKNVNIFIIMMFIIALLSVIDEIWSYVYLFLPYYAIGGLIFSLYSAFRIRTECMVLVDTDSREIILKPFVGKVEHFKLEDFHLTLLFFKVDNGNEFCLVGHEKRFFLPITNIYNSRSKLEKLDKILKENR